MRATIRLLAILAGAILFAAVMFSVISLPGLISDTASTVPLRVTVGAPR